MSDKERFTKPDEESRAWWSELEAYNDTREIWCCGLTKEGNFEEETLKTLNDLVGYGLALKVNFCIHCGSPLKHISNNVIHGGECCCKVTSLIEFAEFFDPKTTDVHRLKGNFCFHCGKAFVKLSRGGCGNEEDRKF